MQYEREGLETEIKKFMFSVKKKYPLILNYESECAKKDIANLLVSTKNDGNQLFKKFEAYLQFMKLFSQVHENVNYDELSKTEKHTFHTCSFEMFLWFPHLNPNAPIQCTSPTIN